MPDARVLELARRLGAAGFQTWATGSRTRGAAK